MPDGNLAKFGVDLAHLHGRNIIQRCEISFRRLAGGLERETHGAARLVQPDVFNAAFPFKQQHGWAAIRRQGYQAVIGANCFQVVQPFAVCRPTEQVRVAIAGLGQGV